MSNPTPDSASVQLSFDDLQKWKPIPGYEGFYEASRDGEIRRIQGVTNTHVGKIIKPHLKSGYKSLMLCMNNVRRSHFVHHLIALTFIGARPSEYHHIDHINRNRLDNRVENLRYLHRHENCGQSHLGNIGERCHNSKLSDCQRCEIKKLYATGSYTCAKLGDMYGVNSSTVYDIVSERKGKHIDCSKFE